MDIRPFANETVVVPACDVMFSEVVCRYLFPNCTLRDTGEVQRARVCFESCDKIVQECGTTIDHFISIFSKRFPDVWDYFNAVHIKLSDLTCSRGLLPSAGSTPGLSCLTLLESNISGLIKFCTCFFMDIFCL